MPPEACTRTAILLGVALSGALSGCALRVGHSEHYIGPVLFRYAHSAEGRTHVTQVLQLGPSAEAGTQWGVSLGVVERTAVAPHSAVGGESTEADTTRWRTPFSPFAPPLADEWHFSVLYLRGDHIPTPCFLRRTVYGAAALIGSEVNALSIGVSTRTRMHPPYDAVSLLSFDARNPLDARLIVWPAGPTREIPVAAIRKEVAQ